MGEREMKGERERECVGGWVCACEREREGKKCQKIFKKIKNLKRPIYSNVSKWMIIWDNSIDKKKYFGAK